MSFSSFKCEDECRYIYIFFSHNCEDECSYWVAMKKYGMSCFQLLRKKVHHYIISVWFRLQLFVAFLLYACNSWSMEHNLSQWRGFVKKPSFWNNITIRCFIYALLFGDEWSCLHCDVWCPYLVLSLLSSFFYLFKYIAHTLMLGCQGWDLDAVSCIVKLFPLIFGVIRQTLSSLITSSSLPWSLFTLCCQ